jgi:hypothetical protein
VRALLAVLAEEREREARAVATALHLYAREERPAG